MWNHDKRLKTRGIRNESKNENSHSYETGEHHSYEQHSRVTDKEPRSESEAFQLREYDQRSIINIFFGISHFENSGFFPSVILIQFDHGFH